MRIVAFGIHPDDVELGCGATVALWAARGHDVVVVDLTRGESSSNGTPEQRAREAGEAARILGCHARENLGLPDAGLRSEDSDQQRAVVGAVRRLRPALVLLPSRDDPHPDHASGAALVERALYLAGVHGYDAGGGEPAWRVRSGLVYAGRRDLDPEVIVDVGDTMQAKLDAIRAHRSQFDAAEGGRDTPLNRPEFLDAVEARAVLAGYRIGARFAESFRLWQPLAVADPSALFGAKDD